MCMVILYDILKICGFSGGSGFRLRSSRPPGAGPSLCSAEAGLRLLARRAL